MNNTWQNLWDPLQTKQENIPINSFSFPRIFILVPTDFKLVPTNFMFVGTKIKLCVEFLKKKKNSHVLSQPPYNSKPASMAFCVT